MRKMLSIVALMMAVMMVASSSYAETNEYTGTYTGSLAGAGLWVATGDPDVGDFGGFGFTGIEGVPSAISIADATGGAVAYTVAQDLDGDLTAGEAGIEPSVSGCGTGGPLEASAIPFVEGVRVVVFLYSGARGTRPCAGAATHGTLTLTTTVA